MAKYLLKTSLVILLLSVSLTQQTVSDNEVDIDDDTSPLQDIASELLKNQNMQNVGAVVSNLMQSGAGKQVGEMLMGMVASGNGANLLQGLGSILAAGSQGSSNNAEEGIDPALIGSMLSLMSSQTGTTAKPTPKSSSSSGDFDIGSILSLAGSFLTQFNGGQSLMNNLPMLLQTFSDFTGPQAVAREESHKDHSWLLPPILEKVHVLFDHFVHSEMGKKIINTVGAEKFMEVFKDDTGSFNYEKFVEMMENHSFRRHWIRMVTDKIGTYVIYMSDPELQKVYLMNGQLILNNYLKTQGFPQRAMLDATRPVESITAAVNYLAHSYLNMQINSKQYVKPAVAYVQDLFRMGKKRGLLTGVDSRELSNKLADTINLEVIEPIARVNRAYRFAKKIPKCDRYVMCLVNEEDQNEKTTLPGLKKALSKGSSLIASWFLSSHTETSFWSLYSVVTEDTDCKGLHRNVCNGFHLEEEKVTTEYVHNEL